MVELFMNNENHVYLRSMSQFYSVLFLEDYDDRELKIDYQKINYNTVDIPSPYFDDEDDSSSPRKMIIIFLKKISDDNSNSDFNSDSDSSPQYKKGHHHHHHHDFDGERDFDDEGFGDDERDFDRDRNDKEIPPNTLRIYFGEDPVCMDCSYYDDSPRTNVLAIINMLLSLAMLIFSLIFFIRANRMLCGNKKLLYVQPKNKKQSEEPKSNEEFEGEDKSNPYIREHNLDSNYNYEDRESKRLDTMYNLFIFNNLQRNWKYWWIKKS